MAVNRPDLHLTTPSDVATLRVRGGAVVYHLYDVGYEIALDRAWHLLGESAPARSRPLRGEAKALVIPNPPLTVPLGRTAIRVAGRSLPADVSAGVYDFGVVSMRLAVREPDEVSWPDFVRFGNVLDAEIDCGPLLRPELDRLLERLRPAIVRPAVAPVVEDYIVFRLTGMRDEAGRAVAPAVLGQADLAPLLLEESRPLSEDARRDLLPYRFSYTTDDLVVLSWDNGLVVEPAAGDVDVEYIIEFANAQLLELRVFDAQLDAELPALYRRIDEARRGAGVFRGRRLRPLLANLQQVVADTTEIVERAENALKVTNDVYLARIYSAALALFRGPAWRSGIDHKLDIFRGTYGMLNAESQAARAEALEVIIVLLIVGELLLGLLRP